MGLAKQRAKKKRPLTPEQQMHRKQVGGMIQADQAQSKGMMDKMMAWKQLQEDKERMVQVPEQYETSQGEMEQLAYVTPEEMEMLSREGGSGEMTPYGVPSFRRKGGTEKGTRRNKNEGKQRGRQGEVTKKRPTRQAGSMGQGRSWSPGAGGSGSSGSATGYGSGPGASGGGQATRPTRQAGSMGDPRDRGGSRHQGGTPRQGAGVAGAYGGGGGGGGGGGYGPPPGVSQAEYDKLKGEYDEYKGGEEGRKQEAIKGYQGERRQELTGEYGDYKGQYKDLGKGFGEDVEKLGAYQGKFDTMAGEARAAQDKGAGQMETIGEGYKGITGDAIAAEAKKGQTGFEEGATKIGGLESGTRDIMGRQAGYEGQIAGMAEKVASGEAGQSQAAMLLGQMEQQRMAGQKGSEEKLRREMAQSGASPAEIASKVAQFQKQSAADQSMASRSEALSSQLQGQQMGQSQMGAAAGLMGQALGATGQQMGAQAQLQSQGAQQAALRGQAAGMGMQGAQAQQAAQLQSLQGQGAAIQSAAGLRGQGIQQQAGMYGAGMGAVQAAGGARTSQGAMVGEQAGMTQAQLNDVIAQQTEQFSADEAEKTRKANAAASSGGGGGGGGGILGGFTKALGLSDIRLKDNIQLLEEGKGGDPNIYSFSYKWDKDTKWRGVMAQELIGTEHSDAVTTNAEGFYMVDYTRLGFPMVKISG